jgi:uncharacterized protein with ParB-like and HNH nuclease domain
VNIKPTDRTIKTLLEGGFYKIPRFQRPYSWDQENVDDFWSDAIANNDPDYFIGSFVLYKEHPQSDIFMVVDGQQRITTATILLAAIRNAFDSIAEDALAKGTQLMIERNDVNNVMRFVVETESSYPYFHEYVQKHGAPQLPKSTGKEEEAIEVAFRYLTKQVNAALDSIDKNTLVPPPKKKIKKRDALKSMRDNVLRLQLIAVELQSEDEAYLIFETLNTRGKDLGISDLVKNLLTRLLKPKNPAVDAAKDKWHSILDRFDESVADIDMNSFIYHSWLSRRSYTGREKLFRLIKAGVQKANASQYLDDLVDDSKLYRLILEPNSGKWTNQETEVADALRALALFKVGQPMPMMLALMRTYRSKQLKLAAVRDTLQTMENFHVQFTALTAQRTGGGTAKMYAASAQELTTAGTPDTRMAALKAFRSKLSARVPSYEQFEASLLELEFLSTNTKQKALVQYVLRRIDAHLRKGAPIAYAKMTIEHIAPEHPPLGTAPLANVGKLGNLVLLDEGTNNKVANKPFDKKLEIFKKVHLPMDAVLSGAALWTDATIEARTKALAKLAYEKIFVV